MPPHRLIHMSCSWFDDSEHAYEDARDAKKPQPTPGGPNRSTYYELDAHCQLTMRPLLSKLCSGEKIIGRYRPTASSEQTLACPMGAHRIERADFE